MNVIKGYKTYIAAVLIGVATALQYTGVISSETFEFIIGLLASLGLVAARIGTVKE